MSKEMVKSYHEKIHQRQGSRGPPEGGGSPTNNSQAAVQVLREKEVENSESAAGQDPDLLEEIQSVCGFNSGLSSTLPPPRARHTNTPRHQVQGEAAEES